MSTSNGPKPRDPYADAPDRWAQADAAWERKWSDDSPAPEGEGPEPPPRPGPGYQPVRPTTGTVTDAYGDGMRAAGPYLGLGLQIAATMAFFFGVGYAADRWLGTSPWGVIGGAALGMVGIVALVMRVAQEASGPRRPGR